MEKPKYNIEEFDFFVDKIRKKERFSVLSFGDGEWSFLFDREKNNETAEQEYFTERVWVGLLQALNMFRNEDVYLTTTLNTKGEVGYEELHDKARVYLEMFGIELDENLKDARLFYDILHECYTGDTRAIRDFADFINVLRKRDVVLVGGKHLNRVKKERFLPNAKVIEIPDDKASHRLNDIIYPIMMHRRPAYFLLSCGMATNMIIKEVHPRLPESSFIDVGAMWDFILNEGGRAEPKWDGLNDRLKKRLKING